MLLGSRDKVLSCPKDIQQGRSKFSWYLSIFSLLCSPHRWHWPTQLWRFVMGVNVGSSVHVGKCGKVPRGKFERPSIPPCLTLSPYILLRTASLERSYNCKAQFYGQNKVLWEKWSCNEEKNADLTVQCYWIIYMVPVYRHGQRTSAFCF